MSTDEFFVNTEPDRELTRVNLCGKEPDGAQIYGTVFLGNGQELLRLARAVTIRELGFEPDPETFARMAEGGRILEPEQPTRTHLERMLGKDVRTVEEEEFLWEGGK